MKTFVEMTWNDPIVNIIQLNTHASGVSNLWNGIWNGTVEWKMEWNSECT